VDIGYDVRLGVENAIAERPSDEHQTVPFGNPLSDGTLVCHMLRKLQGYGRCYVEVEVPGDVHHIRSQRKTSPLVTLKACPAAFSSVAAHVLALAGSPAAVN
jgi:hypothetical protein